MPSCSSVASLSRASSGASSSDNPIEVPNSSVGERMGLVCSATCLDNQSAVAGTRCRLSPRRPSCAGHSPTLAFSASSAWRSGQKLRPNSRRGELPYRLEADRIALRDRDVERPQGAAAVEAEQAAHILRAALQCGVLGMKDAIRDAFAAAPHRAMPRRQHRAWRRPRASCAIRVRLFCRMRACNGASPFSTRGPSPSARSSARRRRSAWHRRRSKRDSRRPEPACPVGCGLCRVAQRRQCGDKGQRFCRRQHIDAAADQHLRLAAARDQRQWRPRVSA